MNRHQTGPALTLRLRVLGESNREGVFLSPEWGLLRATVYGGPKSKLRAYVSPFQSGTLYLYHDTARNSYKVSDFDVSDWRPELREALERSLTAQSLCEALIDGCGGGAESEAAFLLANECLDALRTADDAVCGKIYVHFLWRWLDVLGSRPEMPDAPDAGDAGDAPVPRLFAPDAPARRYLSVTQDLPAREVSRYSLEAAAFERLKSVLCQILREATGRRARDWRGAAR